MDAAAFYDTHFITHIISVPVTSLQTMIVAFYTLA